MQVFLIVAPVFALIAIGYAALLSRLFSEAAHNGISEFTFSIAMPALLFDHRVHRRSCDRALAPLGRLLRRRRHNLVLPSLIAAYGLRRPAPDGASIAIGSVYGNVVMLGIPLALATFGPDAAAPMALILSVNTPLLWIAGTVHMGWADRDADTSLGTLATTLSDLARNPIILAILAGSLWRCLALACIRCPTRFSRCWPSPACLVRWSRWAPASPTSK